MHIQEIIPKNEDQFIKLCKSARAERFLTTDNFNIGDTVFLKQDKTKEKWSIFKFALSSNQEPMALLEKSDWHGLAVKLNEIELFT